MDIQLLRNAPQLWMYERGGFPLLSMDFCISSPCLETRPAYFVQYPDYLHELEARGRH